MNISKNEDLERVGRRLDVNCFVTVFLNCRPNDLASALNKLLKGFAINTASYAVYN
jgi:hypothetical protein